MIFFENNDFRLSINRFKSFNRLSNMTSTSNMTSNIVPVSKELIKPLNWPPTEDDFLVVANWAIATDLQFNQVLVYVKYDPENPLLILNPSHIGPGERYTRNFTIGTPDMTENDRQITIILIEDD